MLGLFCLVAAVLLATADVDSFDIYRLTNEIGASDWGLAQALGLASAVYFSALILLTVSRRGKLGLQGLLVGGLVLACIIRVALAFAVYGTYDVASYEIVSGILRRGGNVYAETHRYRYLPLWQWIIALIDHTAVLSRLPFSALIKLPSTLADLGIGWLLYVGILRAGRGESDAAWSALLYLLSPVSILVTAYHGQFDSLFLFFALLAWYLLRRLDLNHAAWWCGLTLAISILIKPVPVVLVPVFLSRFDAQRQQAVFLAICAFLPLLVSLPDLIAAPLPFVEHVVAYGSESGLWGYSALLGGIAIVLHSPALDTLRHWLASAGQLVTLAAIGLAWWRTAHRLASEVAVVVVLLTFYVFTNGFALQYLAWILPFLILLRRPVLVWAYLLLASCWLVVAYGLPYLSLAPTVSSFWTRGLVRLCGLPVWGVCLAGWLALIRRWRLFSLRNATGGSRPCRC